MDKMTSASHRLGKTEASQVTGFQGISTVCGGEKKTLT